MWVWEPQSVRTAPTCTGVVMSLMSKMRMPSNIPGVEAVTLVLSHVSLLCGVSMDMNSRSPITVTSPCGALQRKSVTTTGVRPGAETSRMRNPP